MLGKLVGSRFALETAIAELTRGGPSAALAESQTQLAAVLSLQGQIGTATPASLAILRAEVAATVAQAQAAAQEGRSAAARAETERAENSVLTTLAATARTQVATTMQGMARFDPYLQFASPDEEEAYRKREADRRAYIDAELAKGTPEGDLNASGGAIGQMADAKTHGAGDSPEFQKRWDALVESTQKLRAEIARKGGDVSKFDARLREDFRAILKSKGLSDTEIDARLAAHPDNPLEAMKAYVTEEDMRQVEVKSDIQAEALLSRSTAEAAPTAAASTTASDAMAKLRAAGVTSSESCPAKPAHGLATDASASTRTGGIC